ncbi:MAG: radical SAM protein [Candidatus Binatia bacterium]|nr:radical SAM protein [Candidatus Binatia bacterium]
MDSYQEFHGAPSQRIPNISAQTPNLVDGSVDRSVDGSVDGSADRSADGASMTGGSVTDGSVTGRQHRLQAGRQVATRIHYLYTQSRQILTENAGLYGDRGWQLQPYSGCAKDVQPPHTGAATTDKRPKGRSSATSAETFADRSNTPGRARRVVVNPASPELLQETLASRRWRSAPITLAGASDCYQPIERQLRLTRRCLEVLAAARNPVVIHTTSDLVLRDLDLLAGLARRRSAQVHLSLTTLDDELAERLEPGHTQPSARLAAIRRLADAGIPTSVVAAPILPGLNDSEIPAILGAAAQAGARSAAWNLGGLPHDTDNAFWNWIQTDRPMMQKKIDYGRQNSSRSAESPSGESTGDHNVSAAYLAQLDALFQSSARRYGLDRPLPLMDGAHFRRPTVQASS